MTHPNNGQEKTFWAEIKNISQPQTDKSGEGNGRKPAVVGISGDISM